LFYGDLTEIYGEKKTGNYQKETEREKEKMEICCKT
jgi:hypothetical protein